MANDSKIPELWDVHEIAAQVHCGVMAVREAIANKELKFRRIGKKFRSTPEEVADWIRKTGDYRAETEQEPARKSGQLRGKRELRALRPAS